MPVLVSRRAPGAPLIATASVVRRAARMMDALGVGAADLSVLLCDDAGIRALNREHRGKDKPTDVLAFPQDDERAAAAERRPRLLGDVAISLETARAQGARRGASLLDEVTFLLAHGLLHLVGFDHQTDAEEREMTSETKRLVAVAEARGPVLAVSETVPAPRRAKPRRPKPAVRRRAQR